MRCRGFMCETNLEVTKTITRHAVTRRIRSCPKCGKRFVTVERFEGYSDNPFGVPATGAPNETNTKKAPGA